eukprot:961019-Amphidinium_carterae.2
MVHFDHLLSRSSLQKRHVAWVCCAFRCTAARTSHLAWLAKSWQLCRVFRLSAWRSATVQVQLPAHEHVLLGTEMQAVTQS